MVPFLGIYLFLTTIGNPLRGSINPQNQDMRGHATRTSLYGAMIVCSGALTVKHAQHVGASFLEGTHFGVEQDPAAANRSVTSRDKFPAPHMLHGTTSLTKIKPAFCKQHDF